MKDQVRDFFYKQGLPPGEKLQRMLTETLKGAGEFAEIYIQNSESRRYRLSEGLIANISESYSTGAGIRVVKGNNTGYSYTEDLSEESIRRCLKDATEIAGDSNKFVVSGYTAKHNLYDIPSSLNDDPAAKVDILRRAEKKAFSMSPLVEKVEAFIGESNSYIMILNSLGVEAYDIRPMISFGSSVIVNKDNLREGAYNGGGGRTNLSYFKQTPPEDIISFFKNDGAGWVVNDAAPDDDVTFVVIKVK